MKRKLIASVSIISLIIAGCIIGYYIHEQVVSKQQSEIENNSRNEYIRQARKQDSLRIAHYQDSLEKAEQLAVAQREREEELRKQTEQEAVERKRKEEAERQNEILAQKKRIQEKNRLLYFKSFKNFENPKSVGRAFALPILFSWWLMQFRERPNFSKFINLPTPLAPSKHFEIGGFKRRWWLWYVAATIGFCSPNMVLYYH